jgi:hypothetical protein
MSAFTEMFGRQEWMLITSTSAMATAFAHWNLTILELDSILFKFKSHTLTIAGDLRPITGLCAFYFYLHVHVIISYGVPVQLVVSHRHSSTSDFVEAFFADVKMTQQNFC